MQDVFDAECPGAVGHRHQRRDADTTGDQDHASRGFVEAEMIARAAHANSIADSQLLVYPLRTATTGRIAQHRDRQ